MRNLLCLLTLCTALTSATFAQRQNNDASPPGCGVSDFTHQTVNEATSFGHGLLAAPRNAIRPKNLKWEVPVAAVTALLITQVDRPANNRIQSPSMEQTAGRWSNVGLGMELAAGAVTYVGGCHSRDHYLRDTGFKALAAMGAASLEDLVLKLAFDRQFPVNHQITGEFWGGGRSFPSGHSANSFAFASVFAHRYPKNKLVKWGSYALATGVSLSRYPAKKHFTSDILVGATLGYVTGTYLSNH
jgi:membrane-associated phospholipid phosphatase